MFGTLSQTRALFGQVQVIVRQQKGGQMKHLNLARVLAVLLVVGLVGCGRKSEKVTDRPGAMEGKPPTRWEGKPTPGTWEGGAELGDLCLRVRFTVAADSTSISDLTYRWTSKGQDRDMLTAPEQTDEFPIKSDNSFSYSSVTGSWSFAPGVTVVLGGDRSFTINGAFTSQSEAEGTVACPVTSLGGPGTKEGRPPTRWKAFPR